MAKYDGYIQYQISFVDMQGAAITTGLSVTVHKAGVAAAATVYSDEYQTAFTNPVTTTVFAANSGNVEFYTDAPVVDLTVTRSDGVINRFVSITPSTKCLTVPVGVGGRYLLYALSAAGATHAGDVDTTVRTALASTTIAANSLKAGDVIHVYGSVIALAQSAAITQTYDIGFGLAGASALGASTAHAISANDVAFIEMYITIRSATSAMATGWYTVTPDAVATVVTKPYWVAAITIATTGIITVGLYNTFQTAAAAGDTCRADQFFVELIRQ